MSSHKHANLPVIEAFLVVVILAIVGFTGYYIWDSNQSTNDVLDAANKSASVKVENKPATPVAVEPVGYLTLSEWGVKIPLTKAVASTYYSYEARNRGYAYLSLRSLADKEPLCAPEQGGLAAISRIRQGDKNPLTGERYTSDYLAQLPKIGNYYYSFEGSHATCTDDKSLEKIQSNAREGLVQAFKGIQAN
jgi:hypothetical protein